MNLDLHLEPHLASSALLTIDVQNDTLDGAPAEIPGTSAALPVIRDLVRSFRCHQRPIVHLVRLYLADGSNVDRCRRAAVTTGAKLFLAGSPGAELAPGLGPVGSALDTQLLLTGRLQQLGPREYALYKPRWGAFFKTGLQDHLTREAIDTLVFAGANFPNCPRTSIWEASERDYRIIVVRDAVSRLSPEGIAQLNDIGVAVWPLLQTQAALNDSLTAHLVEPNGVSDQTL